MKILKFNENIPYSEEDNTNKINLDLVDIKEICPNCGMFAMHLVNMESL